MPLNFLSRTSYSLCLSLASCLSVFFSSLSLFVTCMSVFISSLSLSVTCLSVSISSLSLSVPHMSVITRSFSVCHLLVCLYNLSLSLSIYHLHVCLHSLTFCLSLLSHFLSVTFLSVSNLSPSLQLYVTSLLLSVAVSSKKPSVPSLTKLYLTINNISL